jgi:deoxyribodipyrimidine photo-lyase
VRAGGQTDPARNVRRTVDVADPRRAIAWFRRDLRLADNRVLEAATGAAERVWPVFIADRELIERHAIALGRTAWFGANLVALDRSLGQVGSGLTVLRGEPAEALREFASSIGAQAVYAAADEDPPAVARDGRVAMALDLRLVDDQRIVPDLGTAGGIAYALYTPFRRALDARVDATPEALTGRADADLGRLAPRPSWAPGPEAFPAPEPPHPLPDPGEVAAADRLDAFLRAGIDGYRDERNRPDLDATSHLSPYLRVGAISVRACWRGALAVA